MPKEKEIEDFNQLKTEFQKARQDAKQHIKDDISKFAEIVKSLPQVAREAAARGISDKIEDINQGFSDIDFSEIESEISLGTLAGIKQSENGKWAKDNATRSKIVTGTVTNAKNKITDMKSKMALSAVKVTSLVGKGLVLFGKKGLASRMNETVSKNAEKFVSKDSRVGNLMERVAKNGFSVADGVRDAAKGIGKKAESVKTTVENEVKSRRQAFRDAGTRADLDQMSIARARAEKNKENESWQQVHEGRSSIVTGGVEEIDKQSLNRRARAASRGVKVTGMVAKGVALFGPKGLAEKMQDYTYKHAENRVRRDSIASKIAKTAAEKGFSISSKFKEGLNHTVEMAGAVKNATISTAKETVQKGKDAIDKGKTKVKNGALEFGKRTYQGAATIAALGDIGLEVIGSGVNKVADKVEDGVEFVSNTLEQGVETAKENAQYYKTVAKARISKQKSTTGKGFKEFVKGIAQGVVDKLSPSIDKDQKNIETQDQIIETAKSERKSSKQTVDPIEVDER